MSDTTMDGRHPVELTTMRRAIARRMTDSKRQVPHFYESIDIEMDRLLSSLATRNQDVASESRATVTAALVRGLAEILGKHPAFNAVWNGEILERVDAVNVGVAIDLPDGLLAPAILGCERLTVDEIAEALRELVTRARAGHLRQAEWTDATFTLSNLGMFPIDSFTAIVVPPQVAILATASTKERPVVRHGGIVIHRMMTATLSADHRAVDGVGVARFLADLKGTLEAPESMLDPAARASLDHRHASTNG